MIGLDRHNGRGWAATSPAQYRAGPYSPFAYTQIGVGQDAILNDHGTLPPIRREGDPLAVQISPVPGRAAEWESTTGTERRHCAPSRWPLFGDAR